MMDQKSDLTPEQKEAVDRFEAAKEIFEKSLGMPCAAMQREDGWELPHDKDTTHRFKGFWLLFIDPRPAVLSRNGGQQ